MAEYVASIRVNTQVDTSQMQKLQIQIDKATSKVSELSKKYDELKNKKISTEQYGELEIKLKNAKNVLDSLMIEQKKFGDKGIGQGLDKEILKANAAVQKLKGELQEAISNKNQDLYLAVEDGLNRAKAKLQELMAINPRPLGDITSFGLNEANIKNAEIEISKISSEMQKLVESGKAFTIGGDNEEIMKAANDLSLAQAELRALNTQCDELIMKQNGGIDGFKKLGNVAKRILSSLTNKVKKSSGIMSTMANRLKGILLSLFVFNWITKGFNAMVSSIKTGLNNLIRYSSNANKTMSDFKSQTEQLKNSLATAFAPILGIIIPHLTQLISYLNSACNSIARFLAYMSGNGTYIKAKEQIVDYRKELDATGKSAKKVAGALASFDTLEVFQKKDDSGSGSEAKNSNDMFETVPVGEVSDFSRKIKDAIEAGDWYAVGALIGQKINECLASIDWTGIQEKAAEIGTNIADFLNGAIATIDWYLVGQTLAQGLNTAFVLLYNFITTFDWSQAGLALATAINGFFATVDWALLGQTLSDGFKGIIQWARTALENIDWYAIGEDIATFLKNVDWMGLLKEVGELMVDALVAGLDLLNGFVDALMGNKDAFELIAIAVGAITVALIAYNIQQGLIITGTTLWGVVSGIATAATTALGAAFAFLTSPITLIILAIGAVIAIIYLLVENWDTVKEVAISVWEKICEIWGVFAEWFDKTVWEPFKLGLKALANFFIGIWNGIIGAFESCVNWIIDGINRVLEVINALIRAGGKILEYVGITIDFQIPNLNKVSFGRVPMLANGAVIQGGKPFAAILGDQRFGQTNIEAPSGLIKQMTKEGIAESGLLSGASGIGEAQLIMEGQVVGRILLPHLLSEWNRAGYNISVLE